MTGIFSLQVEYVTFRHSNNKKKKKASGSLLCILSSYAMTSSQMFQGKSASRPRVTPSRCKGTPDDASDSEGGSGRNGSLAASVAQHCLCRSRVARFEKISRHSVLFWLRDASWRAWPEVVTPGYPRKHIYFHYICIFFYIVIVFWHLHLYWLSVMVKSVASRPLHILTSAE